MCARAPALSRLLCLQSRRALHPRSPPRQPAPRATSVAALELSCGQSLGRPAVACQLASLVQVDGVMDSVKRDEETAEIDAEEEQQTTAEQNGQNQ